MPSIADWNIRILLKLVNRKLQEGVFGEKEMRVWPQPHFQKPGHTANGQ